MTDDVISILIFQPTRLSIKKTKCWNWGICEINTTKMGDSNKGKLKLHKFWHLIFADLYWVKTLTHSTSWNKLVYILNLYFVFLSFLFWNYTKSRNLEYLKNVFFWFIFPYLFFHVYLSMQLEGERERLLEVMKTILHFVVCNILYFSVGRVKKKNVSFSVGRKE